MRTGALHLSHISIRLESGIGASFSTMPPVCWGPRARMWRLTILTRSIIAAPSFGRTFRTLPVLRRSRPEITITLSFFRICTSFLSLTWLQHLGRERDNLHEFLRPQLARHRPEDARADRLFLIVDQHRRIRVEANVA